MSGLGKNGQYYYSPDIKVYVKTVNNGVVDLSEDVMSFTINRQTNAVSTANIILANNNFKYTPSSNAGNTSTKPPVVNTMDPITIFLKKEKYLQVFTGFVTYAPVLTLIPSPIEINASCSLYKAQQSFWDAGAIEFQDLIPSFMFNYNNKSGNQDYADGGISTGMHNLLGKVCNWTAGIYISDVPTKWMQNAASLYTQGVGSTSYQSQIAALNNLLQGINISNGKITTTQTATGVVTSFSIPGAPGGTAIPYSSNVVATSAPLSTIKGLVGNGYGLVLGDVSDISETGYWCSIPWAYFNNPVGKTPAEKATYVSNAREFLQGRGNKQFAYPPIDGKPYNRGRLIQMTNPLTGATILCHVAFASPITDQTPANSIILSPKAYADLGGIDGGTLTNLSNLAFVDSNGSTISLKGQQAVPPSSTKNTADNVITLNQASNGVNYTQALTESQITALSFLPKLNNQIDASKMTTILWAQALLLALGIPQAYMNVDLNNLANCSANILNMMIWMQHENGSGTGWLGYNDPLNCTNVLGSAASNPNYGKFRFASVVEGIYGTAQNLLYQFPNNSNGYSKIVNALASNSDLATFCTALASSKWDATKYGGVATCIKNFSATRPTILTNKGTVLQSISPLAPGGTADNMNFTTNTMSPNTNDISTLLVGQPSAFVTDQPALATIQTLATTGLRVFQSAPNGDFCSWFPDYFGLYGTAAALQIRDIEIIDLKIYHDDTQLYTHIGVSGDPIGQGQGVNLADWMQTPGLITVEMPAVLNMLFGYPPTDATTFWQNSSTISNFLTRYGMRPYVDEEPQIRSTIVEFMYALQTFQSLWARQYATQASFTFMPELYPGMIIQLVDHNVQLYVQNVTHQGSRDGGFSTEATLTCPTKLIGGKPVPMHFGYPGVAQA